MKTKIYITGIGSISAQPENAGFEEEVKEYQQNIIPAISPDYKDYIPAMQLRRMSKGIKMGLTAAKSALEDADIEIPDAVITGTGQGSKLDTENFLQNMLDRDEELLSPTSFIQSTHNTVGGQIALSLKCTGYNMTYSQDTSSLESALIDAQLLLNEDPEKKVLVGGVDELSKKITSFQTLDGQVKKEQIENLQLFESGSPGTIISEGAHFFTLSTEKSVASYAEVVDVSVLNIQKEKSVSEKVVEFLQKNNKSPKDIDLVIFGKNGDSRFDFFYEQVHNELFSQKPQLAFKHLAGDYDTVSGYAIVLACSIFRKRIIPSILKLNNLSTKETKEILIYNQYLGKDHSFILLKSSEL